MKKLGKVKVLPLALSVSVCLAVNLQYWRGKSNIPQELILILVGLVMSRAIVRFCRGIHELLNRRATKKPVPAALFSIWMVEVDTELHEGFSLRHFLCHVFVTLILLYTPEQVMGLWASGRIETRVVRTTERVVELASIGGGLSRNAYYTSGQQLLDSKLPPLQVYGEVGYRVKGGWILPRKPTIWYQKFARNKLHDNDNEARVRVERNEAVRVRSIPNALFGLDGGNCSRFLETSFRYTLEMKVCGGLTRLRFTGVDVNMAKTFELHRGWASLNYYSENGVRKIEGGEFQDAQKAQFPRAEAFWNDMGKSFLNALSFNRPKSKVAALERLAISALVRSAWLDSADGFSIPARKTKAQVSDVVTSNIPRAVMGITTACCLILLVDAILVVCTKNVGSFALKDVMHYGAKGGRAAGDWVRVRVGEKTWWDIGSKKELEMDEEEDSSSEMTQEGEGVVGTETSSRKDDDEKGDDEESDSIV